MAKRLEHYRFADSVTKLSAETFNSVLADIDARIDGLEQQRDEYENLLKQLLALGLSRINEVIVPLAIENQDLYDQLRIAVEGIVLPLLPENNLSDLTSASSARSNLGLGSAATHDEGDFMMFDAPALLAENNLSDLTNAATARNNLGLTSTATAESAIVASASTLVKRSAGGDVSAQKFIDNGAEDTSGVPPTLFMGQSGGGTLKAYSANNFVKALAAQMPRTFTWTIRDPAVGGIAGPRLHVDETVLRIDAFVIGGTSATFNIEERTAIGSSGTNLLSSDQVATTSGAYATSFSNSSLGAGNWLWIDVSAVSGTPTELVVVLTTKIG